MIHLEVHAASFRAKPYTPGFFGALRVYRALLDEMSHTAVRRLKGQVDLILCQDLGSPRPECWTARFRDGVRLLPETREGAMVLALALPAPR